MEKQTGEWQASLIEQRTAWGVAAGCMMLVSLAAVRPDWFDLSTWLQPSKRAESVATTLQSSPPQTSAPKAVVAQARPHAMHPPSVRAHHHHAAAATIANGYYVQMGAFQERSRAQGMVKHLKKRGWKAVLTTTRLGLHAVWIGPKRTRSEAERLLKIIRAKLKNKGFIVHQNLA